MDINQGSIATGSDPRPISDRVIASPPPRTLGSINYKPDTLYQMTHPTGATAHEKLKNVFMATGMGPSLSRALVIDIIGDPDEVITITRDEYTSLKADSGFLEALKGQGVDNWDGYGDALEAYAEEAGNDGG